MQDLTQSDCAVNSRADKTRDRSLRPEWLTKHDPLTMIHCLHRGRSRRPVVRIIPDGAFYRIEWPDIGLSDLTNLTRAKAAAEEWAEGRAMTEDRKLPV